MTTKNRMTKGEEGNIVQGGGSLRRGRPRPGRRRQFKKMITKRGTTNIRKKVAKFKETITKKGMTKTMKRASKLKETITRNGTTKTKKKVLELKEMITRKGTTKIKKKIITTKGDDKGGRRW
jgi:hypothetical protein